MRTIVVVLETYSEEPEPLLIDDLKMEINCCWNTFDIKAVCFERPREEK